MESTTVTILWADLVGWWHTVPPDFAFLLALPFFVAAFSFIPDGLRALCRGKNRSKKTKAAVNR
jgi:hypothetical protein